MCDDTSTYAGLNVYVLLLSRKWLCIISLSSPTQRQPKSCKKNGETKWCHILLPGVRVWMYVCVHAWECIHYIMCVHLQVLDKPVADSSKAPQIKGWSRLTSGKLLTWIGITLKIGCLSRSRVSHYWSEVSGIRDDTICAAMTLNMYRQFNNFEIFWQNDYRWLTYVVGTKKSQPIWRLHPVGHPVDRGKFNVSTTFCEKHADVSVACMHHAAFRRWWIDD